MDILNNNNSLEVVCRLRPSNTIQINSKDSVIYVDEEHVQLNSPSNVKCQKIINDIYKFGYVFDPYEEQQIVFNRTCKDLILKLLQGENGLLFTYGVTGSGKTHTIIGTPEDPGILPRLSDVLFNSIQNIAQKCIFKCEGKNKVSIQKYEDSIKDFKLLQETTNYKIMIKDSEMCSNRIIDITKLNVLEDDKIATVFVSYVEIYNQYVYDLLDNDSTIKKEIKLGINGNTYINNIVEVEVSSSEELMAIFKKAKIKRKTAETSMNSNSSRSHSLFMIRLVVSDINKSEYYPIVNDANITQSQIFLVDLAGSERTKKTNAEGERLIEANAINNSLLTLRKCFEGIKINQKRKQKIVVPYRENKLTIFLKNFFEGSGYIRMIVCINPKAEDYDENVHVLSFGQSCQEVNLNIHINKLEESYNLTGNKFHFPKRLFCKWFKEVNEIFNNKEYGLIDSFGSKLNKNIWELCINIRNDILNINCYRDLLLKKLDECKNDLDKIKQANIETDNRIIFLIQKKETLENEIKDSSDCNI
ncbi:Kinesin-like protein KIF23 [Strongyloides ratti]|uniref:Kinesin-like protein n=1 Tax=Strongyloides ratti TaxID=34506 RepID=A0A090MX09_STRRB|nr:Kinesin-like protein KIF23 [Strongyloides ratti]CEF64614.1 Kinesin-like protein KIF23 [Strongyloides ratti]